MNRPTPSSPASALAPDVPPWLARRENVVWAGLVLALLATLALQIVEIGDELLPVSAMYVSAAALGLDAAASGVRKRVGVGPSIANLAPGGWTVFAAMFWILAVPAYLLGARRRVRIEDGTPREPMTWGSWITIGAFAALGLAVALAPLAK